MKGEWKLTQHFDPTPNGRNQSRFRDWWDGWQFGLSGQVFSASGSEDWLKGRAFARRCLMRQAVLRMAAEHQRKVNKS